jgi:hypothetical protein
MEYGSLYDTCHLCLFFFEDINGIDEFVDVIQREDVSAKKIHQRLVCSVIILDTSDSASTTQQIMA